MKIRFSALLSSIWVQKCKSKFRLKSIMLIGLFSIQLILPSTLWAQDVGLIWRYSKGGHDSYLLGSVHFADDSFYPLAPHIMQAYQASSVLVVEVDDAVTPVEMQQTMMARFGQYSEGQSIYDHLKPETISLISALLSEFDVSLTQLQSYRPGMLAITLASLQASKLGYRAEQGLDRYFLQKARYKKTIRQIEDFQFQMELLGQLPEDDESLQKSFRDMQGYEKQWHDMMSDWKSGNGVGLYQTAIGNSLRENPKLSVFFDVLFFDRHPRMVSAAEQCIESKEVCFVVVGAGHLVGEKGLVQALKNRGHKLEQLGLER